MYAEIESLLIGERTRAGQRSAKERGVPFGKKTFQQLYVETSRVAEFQREYAASCEDGVTEMNAPNITSMIVQGLVQNKPIDIKGMTAWLLDEADKSDPFNLRAVLGVEARINGKPGAWVVETTNSGDVLTRLIEGAISEILAKPTQDRAVAGANRRFVE